MTDSAITMYTTSWCGWCERAKALLRSKNASWTEIDVESRPGLRSEMTERTGRQTVPQIYIGETHVGGFDELYALERAGRLDALLNS